MIRSWSHQLLIIYILTIYIPYTKIGNCADFENICIELQIKLIYRKFYNSCHTRRIAILLLFKPMSKLAVMKINSAVS